MYLRRSQIGTLRLHNCLCLSIASRTTRSDSLKLHTPRICLNQYVIYMVRAVRIVIVSLSATLTVELFRHSASDVILSSWHRPLSLHSVWAVPTWHPCVCDNRSLEMVSAREEQLLLTVNLQCCVCIRAIHHFSLVSLARPLPPLHFLQTDVIGRRGRVWWIAYTVFVLSHRNLVAY